MTEVWKSNENKFCKYCKCWVADNKVSWAGHEQGSRHKKAVEEKLSDMKRKAMADQKTAKDEAHWLRKMEEAALRDYKSKDISSNRDFTAKLYNNEDLPDVDVTYEAGPSNSKETVDSSSSENKRQKKTAVDPMMEPTGTEPDKWDKDYEQKMMALNPIPAPTSGTKWHKSSVPKFWYEARTEEGVSYYWHVTTQESRWDKPKGGFVSIEEQQMLASKKVEKEAKRARIQEENKYFHGEHRIDIMRELPDMSANDPYGGGGWSKVEEKRVQEAAPVNLGLPQKREKVQPVIEKKEELNYEFKEKTVKSVNDVSYGLVPDVSSKEPEKLNISKPVISFRKRKNVNIRERSDD